MRNENGLQGFPSQVTAFLHSTGIVYYLDAGLNIIEAQFSLNLGGKGIPQHHNPVKSSYS
ncbi:hypothetical protein DSOL_1084 [Desulfosporosinus metallidurans]|uniref:Uncharacterized protein n=1 Tax=Desulfosporosinus metallidurans TaxID=1888891 RepID=A0A1Q8R031_9FIRM|nr:hypothetical protein DSOL_1084 [Desulfosporosinus metallidurans]